MIESFQDVTFGFRFTSLSNAKVSEFKALLPSVNFTSRTRGADLVVSFDLTENFDMESLCKFIKQSGIARDTYTVWISIVASGDQGGVALPGYILNVIRETSSGVAFSFVSCLQENSQSSNKPEQGKTR